MSLGQLKVLTSAMDSHTSIEITNNINEILFLEYAASLASDAITDAMNNIAVGMTELKLGDYLEKDGQHHSVLTIAASDERYIDDNMYLSAKKMALVIQ